MAKERLASFSEGDARKIAQATRHVLGYGMQGHRYRRRPVNVTASSATGGSNGSNLTDCGCGERIGQLAGVAHECAAIKADYRVSAAYTFQMPELAQSGLSAISEADIILYRGWSVGDECLWREDDDAHDLTCLDAGGTEDTESGHFTLGLIAHSETFDAVPYTLHPKAVLYWTTDDAGDGGIVCDYQAVAFCESFDPLSGGLFVWQPGSCIQVAGCFCVTPYTGRNTCLGCEQAPQVTITMPTFSAPTRPVAIGDTNWDSLWPGAAYSGQEMSVGALVTPPVASNPTASQSNIGGGGPDDLLGGSTADIACGWGCNVNVYSSGKYSFGTGATYYAAFPSTYASCGAGAIPFKYSDDDASWVSTLVYLTVNIYKASAAASSDPAWAVDGSSGWMVAVTWQWNTRNDGIAPSYNSHTVYGVWAANTGIAETESCVSGTFTLPVVDIGAVIVSDDIFDDTSLTITIPETADLTDLDGDGIPEYQPCDSDAADDCGTCEWIYGTFGGDGLTCTCAALGDGTYVWQCVDNGDGNPVGHTPAGCASSCDGYNIGGTCNVATGTYEGWKLFGSKCSGDCTCLPPDTDGTEGEIRAGTCVKTA